VQAAHAELEPSVERRSEDFGGPSQRRTQFYFDGVQPGRTPADGLDHAEPVAPSSDVEQQRMQAGGVPGMCRVGV
jgi:hypothetical protein